MPSCEPWIFLIRNEDREYWGMTMDSSAFVVNSWGVKSSMNLLNTDTLPDNTLVLVSLSNTEVTQGLRTALNSKRCWVHFGTQRSDDSGLTKERVNMLWQQMTPTWGHLLPMPFSMSTYTFWDLCVRNLAKHLRTTPYEMEVLTSALVDIEKAWKKAERIFHLRQPLVNAVTFAFRVSLDPETNDALTPRIKDLLNNMDTNSLLKKERAILNRIRNADSPCPQDLLALADILRRINEEVL